MVNTWVRQKASTPSDAINFTEEVLLHLTEHGYKGRILSVQHIRDLQEEIKRRHKESLLDKEFYNERLAWVDFRIPDNLPEASLA